MKSRVKLFLQKILIRLFAYKSFFLIVLFIISALLGVDGAEYMSALGAVLILLVEVWYCYLFIGYLGKRNFISLILLMLLIPVAIYGLLFPYINNLELWVDEIGVINIARLPLGSIAREAMTTHVTVPPLDYWNMWAWNKFAVLFPIPVLEFIYRFPYMVMHSISAFLFAFLIKKNKKITFTSLIVSIMLFLLYFFNPLLFIYSYEVRFYTMTFMGALITFILFERNKLFELKYIPLSLLFCLNSVLHFLILAPFICFGLFQRVNKKNVLILGLLLLLMGFMTLLKVYIPQPLETTNYSKQISDNLTWLYSVYFDADWKSYIAYMLLVLLIIFHPKDSLFIMILVVIYIVSLFYIDKYINYRYFGAKHFLFIMPFLSVLVLKLFSIGKSSIYKAAISIIIYLIFLLPFYSYLQKVVRGEIIIAKSPMGIKEVFATADKNKMDKILISYGDSSTEDIDYDRIGFTWYSQLYPHIIIVDSIDTDVCGLFSNEPSVILYYLPGVHECSYTFEVTGKYLFGSKMVFRKKD